MEDHKNIPDIKPADNQQPIVASDSKRDWASYIKEFLMLFLAVFAGFLAENYRENLTERAQEKQYMQSLLMDLKEDTIELKKSIEKATFLANKSDSIIMYLYKNPPSDFVSHQFVQLSFDALSRLDVIFSEVTAIQLKNSGNMRLIRNKDIIRNISVYWREQEKIKIFLERILLYRNRAREKEEKLFARSQISLVWYGITNKDDRGVKVINRDAALWSEYANVVDATSGTTFDMMAQLKKQLLMSNKLINIIKKEYTLD
jgi:hypothetical protein